MSHWLLRLWAAYRMRMKRRRLCIRSFNARRQLTLAVDNTDQIHNGDVLLFSVVRNEADRLPYFLSHYRALGVGHFFMVLNDCDDETQTLLSQQPDVSIWRTNESYKASRFGVDWLTALQFRYGHGSWCLSVDADELLIYPHWQSRDLRSLTQHLVRTGATAMGALMLDLYPKGPLNEQDHIAGQDPTDVLSWFDAEPYRASRQEPMGNLWLQGGPRDRMFFADTPQRAPTLNKLPLVRWSRRFAYVNSTHSLLPPRLNMEWDGPKCVSGDDRLSGVLLHTKFLPGVIERSREERDRQQHFGQPEQFGNYYDWIIGKPNLWHENAVRYQDWQQLEELGLLSTGGWD